MYKSGIIYELYYSKKKEQMCLFLSGSDYMDGFDCFIYQSCCIISEYFKRISATQTADSVKHSLFQYSFTSTYVDSHPQIVLVDQEKSTFASPFMLLFAAFIQ
jgi:hypothetical protein